MKGKEVWKYTSQIRDILCLGPLCISYDIIVRVRKIKLIDWCKVSKSLSTNLSFSSFSQGGLGVGCHPCFCKGFHCRLEIHRTGAKGLSPGMFTLTTRKLRPTLTLQQSGSISNHDALLTENRIMNSNTKRMFRKEIVL